MAVRHGGILSRSSGYFEQTEDATNGGAREFVQNSLKTDPYVRKRLKICQSMLSTGYLLVNLDFFRFWPISLEIEFFYQK